MGNQIELSCRTSLDYEKKSIEYQCGECGKRFPGKNGKANYKIHWIEQHLQSQANYSLNMEYEFPCGACEFKTKDKNEFRNHIQSDHDKSDVESYDCSLCEFKNSSISKFNSHLKNHKHYRCLTCQNNFHGPNSRALFRMHLQKSKEVDFVNPCSGQKQITCDICKFECNEDNSFKTHFESKHEQKGNRKSYNCSMCDFTTHTGFIQRIINHFKVHPKCYICGQQYHGSNGARSLKNHMIKRHHQPPKPIKLVYSKSSKEPVAVKEPGAVAVQNSQGTYDCSKCGKSWPYLSHFIRHNKVCNPKKEMPKNELPKTEEHKPIMEPIQDHSNLDAARSA